MWKYMSHTKTSHLIIVPYFMWIHFWIIGPVYFFYFYWGQYHIKNKISPWNSILYNYSETLRLVAYDFFLIFFLIFNIPDFFCTSIDFQSNKSNANVQNDLTYVSNFMAIWSLKKYTQLAENTDFYTISTKFQSISAKTSNCIKISYIGQILSKIGMWLI